MADPTPVPDQDAFNAAFAEALKDDAPAPAPAAAGTAQDPPGGEKPPAEEPAPAAEPAPATEPPAEEAAAAAVETAAAAAAEPAPAAPAAAPAGETPEAELVRLRAEMAALKALAPKQAEPAAAPAAEPAPAPQKIADPKWYQPTDDEQSRLANFQKDWPDIYEATQVATKQAAYNVAEYIFNQIAKVYNPTLEQFAQTTQTLQEQIALSELRGAHKDYDAIYDNVVAWVNTLPAPFKRGALETMESGTPDEVSQLIQSYKNATGGAAAGTPAATTGSAPAPVPTAPKTTGLSAAANKAASKLQVVGSKRTTPTPQADANDFDGAWAEALRQNG